MRAAVSAQVVPANVAFWASGWTNGPVSIHISICSSICECLPLAGLLLVDGSVLATETPKAGCGLSSVLTCSLAGELKLIWVKMKPGAAGFVRCFHWQPMFDPKGRRGSKSLHGMEGSGGDGSQH